MDTTFLWGNASRVVAEQLKKIIIKNNSDSVSRAADSIAQVISAKGIVTTMAAWTDTPSITCGSVAYVFVHTLLYTCRMCLSPVNISPRTETTQHLHLLPICPQHPQSIRRHMQSPVRSASLQLETEQPRAERVGLSCGTVSCASRLYNKKDEPFKRFQSQGHQNEQECVCLSCISLPSFQVSMS